MECGAFPQITGGAETICVERRDGIAIFEGDIVVAESAESNGRRGAAILSDEYGSNYNPRWPEGVIPYVIHANNSTAHIYQAISLLAQTPVLLIPRTVETDYVEFYNAPGMQFLFGEGG